MKFELTMKQTERFVEWRTRQVSKGRYTEGPRFAFVFAPSHSLMRVKVVDQATKEELELTES